MKLPEEYWERIERKPLPQSGPSSRRWLRQLQSDLDDVCSIILSSQDDRVLVRGQSDADYGLSSSLFRKALTVYSMSSLSERRLADLEFEVLEFARRSGLGRGMTNLQLLHGLQHFRLPTRLIDVSRDPVSALWFACNDRGRKDGRLFLFAVPPDSVREDDTNLRMVPWAGIRLSHWTNKVLLLDAPASNPRMAAQDGAFLVGGLARNYAGQQRLMKDKYGRWRYVPAEQIHEISEIFVKFPQVLTRRQVTRWRRTETYGVTWRIPASWKASLLEAMRLLGVKDATMYPNFDAVRSPLDVALHFGSVL